MRRAGGAEHQRRAIHAALSDAAFQWEEPEGRSKHKKEKSATLLLIQVLLIKYWGKKKWCDVAKTFVRVQLRFRSNPFLSFFHLFPVITSYHTIYGIFRIIETTNLRNIQSAMSRFGTCAVAVT